MYTYIFDAENCWYRDVCDKFNTDKCSKNCIRYMEMHYLIETSRIPKAKQFQNKLQAPVIDVNNFKFLNNIKQDMTTFINNGENLYIYSKYYGNGKTTWAIKLMQSYFNKIWNGNGFTVRGLFIHVPSFVIKYKDVMRQPDSDFEELKSIIPTVDLIIWDDIASSKLSEFEAANLLAYIDQRIMNGKSNIFTGMLDYNQLALAVGNKLSSKIWNNSSIVELLGQGRKEIKNG